MDMLSTQYINDGEDKIMRIKTYAVTFKSESGTEKVLYIKATGMKQANDKACNIQTKNAGWSVTNIRAI